MQIPFQCINVNQMLGEVIVVHRRHPYNPLTGILRASDAETITIEIGETPLTIAVDMIDRIERTVVEPIGNHHHAGKVLTTDGPRTPAEALLAGAELPVLPKHPKVQDIAAALVALGLATQVDA